MASDKLAFLFQVILYVGLGLPLVNLLLGLIGSFGHSSPEVDTDFSPDADVDVDTDLDFDTDLDLDTDVDVSFDAEVSGGEVHGDAIGAEAATGGSHGFFVRFNVYCMCLAMVVLGAMGIFAVERFTGMTQLAVIGLGVIFAITAYILLYRFLILPLKRNDAKALQNSHLRYKHAIVTFRIKKDSPGKIKTIDAVGATITYQAEIDADLSKLALIEEGEEVIITDLNLAEGLCFVIPAQHTILNGGNV